MPIDYYPQKSAEQLLTILEQLQQRQTAGAITEVSAAGLRTVKQIGAGNSTTGLELRRVLYSLFLRDPDHYANPHATRTRKTRAKYTFS